MKDLTKYKGVIPAFYACYDENGEISQDRVKSLVQYFIDKGVKGIYVNGSSGECIYQSVEDRKQIIEAVMEVAKGKLTVINHIACNNTKDSIELAKHSESVGVDAIAAIPPIYFKLPEYSIAAYWNAMSEAASNTDFIIYNIPQLAGVALTGSLYATMRQNPRVKSLIQERDLDTAKKLQYAINEVIYKMISGKANMYAVAKEVLRLNEKLDLGSVRQPLEALAEGDLEVAKQAAELIQQARKEFL
ncbi:N-acetylneuraminate lyase [Streptococcus pneumoniae]|uniref:N-acetylneuraminate lyase n=1 Tax=Streptococcus pneumoniae TaxID=1313 RepID=A0A4J2B9L6_STREE|nr:N-acetylneuraminate lyase [Streptococcus pneumoniae]VNC69261.1 N-acetylneuraminate lyase [Streptococcus pneumoniae]VNJ43097.1 N-acetylneuraminate lyase [Streptococcus pneumoniae]VNK12107.1 N-acetylneuraminate lyase [Streptococcus pneumoniae]VNK19309.1 N-acetylneuraminate lyase [Streptococcus pneumoniae]